MTEPDPLVAMARGAALKAHAPYSGFHVGCAIEAVDGSVAVGANMENASYRLGTCAEQAALAAAQQAFGLANVARIAIVGGSLSNGALVGSDPVTPCGGCRQTIHEAASLSGRDIAIVCAAAEGSEISATSICALLPDAFGPGSLR